MAIAGAGADVTVMGTGAATFVGFSVATAGGFASLAITGAGADVGAIGRGTATSLALVVFMVALVGVLVLVS